MKRFALSIALLGLIQTTAFADDDKPIQFSQLPATAQQFIKEYFGDKKIALAKMESDFFGKNYDVIFANGDKVECDRSGEWTEVKCKYTQVPDKLVPEQVKKFVTENYPESKVVKFERDRNDYEVKLSNGWELTFDKQYQLIDMDN